MFRILASIFYLFFVLSVTMMFSLNFIVSFSLLRTKPRGEFFFAVGVTTVSTPFRLVVHHPRLLAKRLPAPSPPPPSGISVSVTPPIM
jgi:hypothetical protein